MNAPKSISNDRPTSSSNDAESKHVACNAACREGAVLRASMKADLGYLVGGLVAERQVAQSDACSRDGYDQGRPTAPTVA
jgi:predicted metal-binding protein